MKISNQHYHTIWWQTESTIPCLQIIDQRFLPHRLMIETLTSVTEVARAIADMHLRGAPLIGAAAAFGMHFAVKEALESPDFDVAIQQAAQQLHHTRPTAINLDWAINQQLTVIQQNTPDQALAATLELAHQIKQDSIDRCRKIGEHGLPIIQKLSEAKQGETVHILTHCNAGWLACVDYGTATAPIYLAHDKGIKVHVWVDETRPRNQGARLTAYELQEHGVPHTVIPDNVGGHLMQHALVDMVIVGTDRTTRTGDVANKIGTYLKALAAKDNQVPFYVALPSSTIDWTIRDGLTEIPIEERGAEEVQYIQGWHESAIKKVLLTPKDSPATNFAFDVTPARLVSALITEKGICAASEKGLMDLFGQNETINLDSPS